METSGFIQFNGDRVGYNSTMGSCDRLSLLQLSHSIHLHGRAEKRMNVRRFLREKGWECNIFIRNQYRPVILFNLVVTE